MREHFLFGKAQDLTLISIKVKGPLFDLASKSAVFAMIDGLLADI